MWENLLILATVILVPMISVEYSLWRGKREFQKIAEKYNIEDLGQILKDIKEAFEDEEEKEEKTLSNLKQEYEETFGKVKD